MDDRPNIPESNPLDEPFDASRQLERGASEENRAEVREEAPEPAAPTLGMAPIVDVPGYIPGSEAIESRRRGFRQNLLVLLGLALTAFVLTSWILVRVDSPFGVFSSGPQDVVRAQLRALDRGELRPAYDMFSPRYRGQVSFDTWHELFLTHWRMFHASIVQVESPEPSGPGVSLEIYLRGSDDKDYRARFTLIRSDGRWWIDDVHWTEEPNESDFSRT